MTGAPSRRDFGWSALPRTTALAALVRPLLEAELAGHDSWSFEDRLFVWLLPDMVERVGKYYDGHGPPLKDLHSTHLLVQLDCELFGDLVARIDRSLARAIRLLRRRHKRR